MSNSSKTYTVTVSVKGSNMEWIIGEENIVQSVGTGAVPQAYKTRVISEFDAYQRFIYQQSCQDRLCYQE